MTLLTCVFAAVICTILWYKNPGSVMKLGTLSLMYWGASLMWFVDAIAEYMELKAEYFTPEPLDMLNDFYLGLSVVAFGLIIWIAIVLIKDPKGTLRAALRR